jgi:hypothetical protein
MKCEDGYALYEQLKDGASVEVNYAGKNYGFAFVGERTGTRNYLVRSPRFHERWGSSARAFCR